MRQLIALVIVAGCGSRAAPIAPASEADVPDLPVSVEWKVEQGEEDRVEVSIVVDSTTLQVGPLIASTEHEPGTPATCALRAANPTRTEIVCGDANSYAAELGEGVLVISFVGEQKAVVKRVPVNGNRLAVKPLRLPLEQKPKPSDG